MLTSAGVSMGLQAGSSCCENLESAHYNNETSHLNYEEWEKNFINYSDCTRTANLISSSN